MTLYKNGIIKNDTDSCKLPLSKPQSTDRAVGAHAQDWMGPFMFTSSMLKATLKRERGFCSARFPTFQFCHTIMRMPKKIFAIGVDTLYMQSIFQSHGKQIFLTQPNFLRKLSHLQDQRFSNQTARPFHVSVPLRTKVF